MNDYLKFYIQYASHQMKEAIPEEFAELFKNHRTFVFYFVDQHKKTHIVEALGTTFYEAQNIAQKILLKKLPYIEITSMNAYEK